MFKRSKTEVTKNDDHQIIARAGSGIDELFERISRIEKGVEGILIILEHNTDNQKKFDTAVRNIGKIVTPFPAILEEIGEAILQKLKDLNISIIPTETENNGNEELRTLNSGINSIKIVVDELLSRLNTFPSIETTTPKGENDVEYILERGRAYKREAIEERTQGGRRQVCLNAENKPGWYLVVAHPNDNVLDAVSDAILTRRHLEGRPYYLAGTKKLKPQQVPPSIWMVLANETDINKIKIPNDIQKLSKMTRDNGILLLSPIWADYTGRVLLDHLESLSIIVEEHSKSQQVLNENQV